jgi:hypothetical protein
MGVRINELTEAVQANGVDILELEQGAQSKKISIARAVGKIATAEAAASPYTVTNNDVNIDVQFTTGTVNLPAATGTGRNLRIIKTDSTGGTVTITPNGSDTIEGNASVALYAQYDYIELLDIASGVWKVVDHKIAQVTTTDTSYTVQPLDETVNLNFETGTVSLPAATGTGRELKFIKIHSTENDITITPDGTDTIEGEGSEKIRSEYSFMILKDAKAGVWELIDCKDHGTFTPVLTFGGGSTGITYSERSGAYFRNKKTITFDLSIYLTNRGSSTGIMAITGLPFSPENQTPISWYQSKASVVTDEDKTALINTSGEAYLLHIIHSSSSTRYQLTDFLNDAVIVMSGTFIKA